MENFNMSREEYNEKVANGEIIASLEEPKGISKL